MELKGDFRVTFRQKMSSTDSSCSAMLLTSTSFTYKNKGPQRIVDPHFPWSIGEYFDCFIVLFPYKKCCFYYCAVYLKVGFATRNWQHSIVHLQSGTPHRAEFVCNFFPLDQADDAAV